MSFLTKGLSRTQVLIISICSLIGLLSLELYLHTHHNLQEASVIFIENRVIALFESLHALFNFANSEFWQVKFFVFLIDLLGFTFYLFALIFDLIRIGLLLLFLWLIITHLRKPQAQTVIPPMQ